MRKPFKEDLLAKYRNQKWYNHGRGVPFLLTFEEWLEIWTASGHLAERGIRPEQYCMARGTSENPDVGAYVTGNVRIVTNRENRAEQDMSYLNGNKHALGSKHTTEWKRTASSRLRGNRYAASPWSEEEKKLISHRSKKTWRFRKFMKRLHESLHRT